MIKTIYTPENNEFNPLEFYDKIRNTSDEHIEYIDFTEIIYKNPIKVLNLITNDFGYNKLFNVLTDNSLVIAKLEFTATPTKIKLGFFDKTEYNEDTDDYDTKRNIQNCISEGPLKIKITTATPPSIKLLKAIIRDCNHVSTNELITNDEIVTCTQNHWENPTEWSYEFYPLLFIEQFEEN